MLAGPMPHSDRPWIMGLNFHRSLPPLGVVAFAVTGPVVASAGDDAAWRSRALQVLRHELATTSGWIRIHAAEALIEHQHPDGIAALYRPELDSATPPYRIGVRRVLARVMSPGGNRNEHIEFIRAVLADPIAPDRVHAAETLAKLGGAQPADRAPIDRWLESADAPTSAYLRWLRVQLASEDERPGEELALAALLGDANPTARLRAAYALARLPRLAPPTEERLRAAADDEPTGSPAFAYLQVAAFLHLPASTPGRERLKERLHACLARGGPAQIFEVAPALGRGGGRDDIPGIAKILEADHPDARIGAASGLLYLLR